MEKRMDKQKKIDPCNKDCANCGTSGAKLTCGACKAAHYCSKACQKQHWKNGHKGACIAPEKRRPQQAPSMNSVGAAAGLAAEETSKVVDPSECPICLDFYHRARCVRFRANMTSTENVWSSCGSMACFRHAPSAAQAFLMDLRSFSKMRSECTLL